MIEVTDTTEKKADKARDDYTRFWQLATNAAVLEQLDKFEANFNHDVLKIVTNPKEIK